jgi:hypothetical protein
MADILKDPADLEAVRTIVGLDSDNLTDEQISNTYIDPAENDLAKALAGGSVTLTIAQIMGLTNGATAADKIHLIEATRNYVAYRATPALPVLLNTSETVGLETQDAGTTQGWKDQADRFLAEYDKQLGKITGFRRWRTL